MFHNDIPRICGILLTPKFLKLGSGSGGICRCTFREGRTSGLGGVKSENFSPLSEKELQYLGQAAHSVGFHCDANIGYPN
jgi:hypothetical protein